MGSPAPLAFSAFNGNLAVDASGSSLLGRMRVSWAVDADPAAFELAIQQNGVNMTGRVYSLAGSRREQLITGLADGSGVYSAVISARNAAGLVVASLSKPFNVKHAAASDMQLAGSCAAATGIVTVIFTPIPGFLGPYKVSCNGVVKDVSNSPVLFDFAAENLSGAALKLSTVVDGIALGDFTSSVKIDRQVRYDSFSVAQSLSQQKQGKATVNFSTSFADASSSYTLEVSGGSGWTTKQSNILNNAEISMVKGVYDFRLKAVGVGASLDNGLLSSPYRITIQKTLLIPARVAGSASGKVTVEADDIGATSSNYTFDISGGAQNNAMNALNPHVGSIVLPNGTYQIRVKVVNNGENALSDDWMSVIIAKTSVISNMAVDERMYSSLGKIELTWNHAQSSGPCAYVAKLRNAATGAYVGSNVLLSVPADAAAGSKTLVLSPPTAGAYVVRLEVTVNGIGEPFYNEVIVYLANAPLTLQPHRAVVVDLGVALDARADAAVLDAATPLVSGNVVTCETTLPASALYANASGGLIAFWEPSDAIGTIKAKFTVDAAGAAEPLAYNGISHAKNLVLGVHSCLTKDLDCSATAPFAALANAAYDQYASVGDMTLGYIAQKLFGHPAATAAITNDAHIKDTMNASPGANAAAVPLGSAVAASSLNSSSAAGDQKLALRLVQTMLFAAQGADASPAARATRIANSVIGQDADRAHGMDNNQLTPDMTVALPFYANDVLFFKLTLKSLDVFKSRLGDPTYAALKARLVDQEFTFKITLA